MTSVAKQDQTPKQVVVVQSLTGLKHILYGVVAFFSFILFIISCATTIYEKDRYGGYNPPAAELAFTGAFGALFIPLFIWAQRVRPDASLNSMAVELGIDSFMWLFLLGGVGALTSQTYDLPACQKLYICRGFSTMMAFAWMSWITISVTLGFKLFIIGTLWSRQIAINWLAPTKDSYSSMKDKNATKIDESFEEKQAEV